MAFALARWAEEAGFTAERRRYVFGGWLSSALGTYDLFLTVIVLPAAIAYFEPPSLPAVVQVTLVNLTFLISILAAPIGGLILAPLGDRVGRRTLVVIAGGGYALVTLLMAILPGYASWGYGAIGALLFLRFLGSAMSSATVGASVAIALEWTPKPWRGLIGGCLGVAPTSGVILLSAAQLAALKIWPGPAFVHTGWRAPFLFATVLGVALLFSVFLRMRDVEYFEHRRHQREARPIRSVFSRANIHMFGQGFLLYSGYLFAIQVAVTFLPSLLINYLKQPPSQVTGLVLVGNVGILISGVILGAISQRIGRRTALILGGAWIVVLSTLFYYFMIAAAAHGAGFATVGLLGFAVIVLSVAPFSGMVLTYLAERYPIQIRATGFTAVITLANIIPGFSSFILLGLSRFMPYQYTVLVLVVLAGLLTAVGAWAGPETRDVDMVPTEEVESSRTAQ
ncbi:MAG: MFS transporter [Firmicutes bacterium]|nr:MFS transporter [Alicyclobacillaceae bacterium]MCL6498052.1 MFS transporter [Bacillota bacterium]